VRGAAKIADAGRPHAIGDFLGPDGKEVDHPADTWNENLATLEKRESELATMRAQADRLVKSCRDDVAPLLYRAEGAFERVATPTELTDLDEPFNELQGELDEKLKDPSCVESRLAPLQAAAFTPREVAGKVRGALQNGQVKAKLTGLALLTGAWILGALIVAFFTIKYANYEAKDTFGTTEDWFALVTAALASGVAATILGLLAPWGAAQVDE
jgi:hypothetical protein